MARKKAAVVGVSKDSPAALARWKEKLGLPFPLLSDPDAGVQKAYGVWKEKNMYGKKVMGTERTTVIVGPDGKVERVFAKVKVDGHAAEVLAALSRG
jgi:peroxiredoxin Q/BCP